jgi:hypothetical protein
MFAPRAALAFRIMTLAVLAGGGWAWLSLARPGAATSSLIRFAVIGDYGADSVGQGQPERDVANLVKSWNPDFIITTGDNNYPVGAAATIDQNIGRYYAEYIYPYTGAYTASIPPNRFFPSLGNHDWYTQSASAYFDYFTLPGNEAYYDFVWGPVHFFALDSEPMVTTTITATQSAWLQTQLAQSTAPWQIVYMHHPPFTSGATHTSTTILQWPYQDWGVDAVLTGHNHIYERLFVNGGLYFVNGLGGAAIQPMGAPAAGSLVRYNSNYGAMLVQASEAAITFQFISRSGAVRDMCTLTRPGAAGTPAPPPTAPNIVYLPIIVRDFRDCRQ